MDTREHNAEELTSLEALGIAIRLEADAADVYRELAPGVTLKLPPSRLPRDMGTAEQRQARTIREVIDFAIIQERNGREFYLEAARRTSDLSGQAMFRYLADIKHAHWMSLAQERDLLIQYPNYGRRGPVPWRTEPSMRGRPDKGTR